MNKKWNKHRRKGYLKIHVAVDIRSKKILSMEVTDEHVHDNKMLPKLVDGVIKSNNGFTTIDKLLADGAYDSNDTFRCLSENGITPCIKVRKDARVRKTSHHFRNLSVLAQRNDIQQWKNSVSYGQRWIVETVFSTIKRMFGEYVYSVKMKNMKQELMLKASLYNKFMSL